ncbi:MAG: hypothetical protein RLY20_53 [Verrucomicrobiota bacterium]|jgi:hypothetical protein
MKTKSPVMKNDIETLSVAEAQRLTELEQTIARGQQTFVEVGLALAEIRDLRLYKAEHRTFELYCRAKWGWTRQRAYQLMGAAEVKMSTRVDIPDEAAARQLGRFEPDQRAGIVQTIVDEGKPVTAAEIRRHLPPPPIHRSPMPAPPAPVLDATGHPVPTQLIPLWKRADEVQELLTILSRVKGALRSAQENKDILFAEINFSSALSQLDQAWADIKRARPFAVCPTCQGQLPDHCTLCYGRGIISEFRWNTCVPREDKEFRAKVSRANPSRN